MPKVLVASSLGPGKEYTHSLLTSVLGSLSGYWAALLVLDGVGYPPDSLLHATRCLSLSDPGPKLNIFGRIARMREESRRYFLRTDCTHLYWHDSDMAPPADIIERLIEHRVPVANGFYAIRGTDPEAPVLAFMTREWDPDEPHRLGAQIDEVEVIDGCISPLACGMGCMLVEREVLERTPFRDPLRFTPDTYGEDVQWCLDSGVRPLIDTRLRVWHIDEDGTGVRPGTEVQ